MENQVKIASGSKTLTYQIEPEQLPSGLVIHSTSYLRGPAAHGGSERWASIEIWGGGQQTYGNCQETETNELVLMARSLSPHLDPERKVRIDINRSSIGLTGGLWSAKIYCSNNMSKWIVRATEVNLAALLAVTITASYLYPAGNLKIATPETADA